MTDKMLVLEILKVLDNALSNSKDNLNRARGSFKGYGYNLLCSEYGASGETPLEILGEYEHQKQILEECIEWVKSKDDGG